MNTHLLLHVHKNFTQYFTIRDTRTGGYQSKVMRKTIDIEDANSASSIPYTNMRVGKLVCILLTQAEITRVEEICFSLVRNRRFLIVFLREKRSKPLRGNRRFFFSISSLILCKK